MNIYKRLDLHLLFEAGVIVKGIHALIELVVAFIVYYLGNHALLIVTRISSGELGEDPKDIVMNFVVQQAHHLVSVHGFVALYLVISAIINLILVVALLSGRLKAYPVAIGILSVFVMYQAYRIFLTHSLWLTIFTLFDALVIYLIYSEYQRQKQLREKTGDANNVPAVENA